MRILVLCINLFYVLSTISVYKENSENTRWTPWGWEILRLSPMVSVGQIVTGAADKIPDLEGK